MNKQEKEIIKNVVKRADVMIEKLSVWVDEVKDIKATSLAQLAESDEKPKPLEHGDYGRAKSNHGDEPIDRRLYANGHSWGIVGNDPCDETPLCFVLGNIFKELAALKPIREFEYKGYTDGRMIVLDSEGDIDFGSLRRIKKDDIHAFILKLRGMEAQMKLDAK